MKFNSILMSLILTIALFVTGCAPNDTAAQIKVSWNPQVSPTGKYPVVYHVYYVAGDDTTKFPVKLGATDADIWDWQVGTTIQSYFYVKNDGYGKYFRVGVIPYSWDETPGPIAILTFERSRPMPITGLQIQFFP